MHTPGELPAFPPGAPPPRTTPPHTPGPQAPPPETSPPAETPPAASAGASEPDVADPRRRRLDALLAEGLLTPEDHAAATGRLGDDDAFTPHRPGVVDEPAGPPPGLARAGGRAGEILRQLFSGEMKSLWIAAAVAAVATGAAAVLLAVTVGGVESAEGASVLRQLYLTFTAAAPVSVHAALTASAEGMARGSEVVTARGAANLPLSSLSLLLLGIFGIGVRRIWASRPEPATLGDAAVEVGRAAVAFTGVLVSLAVLARISITQAVRGGEVVIGLGVSPGSALVWAGLLGGATAAAVMALRLSHRLNGLAVPAWAREAATAVRGAATAVVLLAVVGVVFTAVFVATDPSGTSLGSRIGIAAALLPSLVFAGMSLAAGIPFKIDISEIGGPAAPEAIGLFGATPGGPPVPLWAWIGFAFAMAALVVGGLAATWSASRQGLPTTRVGAAQGLVLALVWVPLTRLLGLVATGSADGGGPAGRVLGDLVGVGSLADGVTVSAGVGAGRSFLTMLVVGGALGWAGSLLAAPLWGKLPAPLFRLLGGAEFSTGAVRAATAAARDVTVDSALRLRADAVSGWGATLPTEGAPTPAGGGAATAPTDSSTATSAGPDEEALRRLTEAFAGGRISREEFLRGQAALLEGWPT